MERLMQYVWQHRLWPPQSMATVDGLTVQVIDPGRLNTDAGPDFFNAKIKIDGRLWAGDVEIHVKASDWHRHGHDGDPAYNSVILHVVDRDDTMIRRRDGQVIPQMRMPCSPTLNLDYRNLVERAAVDLPCAPYLPSVSTLYLTDWMSALAFERLHAKSDRIEALRALTSGDTSEACYVILARALGFGVNSDPFERLARSLPLKLINKHGDSLLSIEALLFGQSGLLAPFDAAEPDDPYLKQLVREYRFLATKFSLKPLQSPGWKMGRMRPQNFPHRRIAWLAQLLHGAHTSLHSAILDCASVEAARALFDVRLTGYWASHCHFATSGAASGAHGMSRASIDLLIINVVAPVMFNHALHTGDDSYIGRAMEMLESLPPEHNSIIAMFERAGLKARDASMSQALVHLRRNYCETRKCLYCRLGHRVLSSCARRRD